MTRKALRDWHAKRMGWAWEEDHFVEATYSRWLKRGRVCPDDHPIPDTLDAAFAMLPKGGVWQRLTCGNDLAVVWRWGNGAVTVDHHGTNDTRKDVLTLAKLAWEKIKEQA